jgi:hypothetical protein
MLPVPAVVGCCLGGYIWACRSFSKSQLSIIRMQTRSTSFGGCGGVDSHQLRCGTWDVGLGTGYFMLDVSSFGVYVLWFVSGC